MAGSRGARRVRRAHSVESGLPRAAGTHAALAEVVQRVLRQEAALYRIASLGYQPFAIRLREIARLDATTLDVARVSFWVMNDVQEAIQCEELYLLRGDRHESGTVLTAREFPRYFKALKTGEPIPADDALSDQRTNEFAEAYLRPLGIGSMLDVPVFLGGALYGVVCHEHVGPARTWTRDEQLFAMSVGQSIALSVEAERRDQTERALRDSEHRLKAILEASPIPMTVSTVPEGEIIYANAGIGTLFGLPVDKAVGSRALDFYADPSQGNGLLAEIESQGRILEREVQLKRVDGTKYWALVSTVKAELDGRAVLVASIWDVTSKREAEEKLRHAALYDELTGLPNRTLLFDLLCAELARVDRHDQPFAMLYMDLDDFKQVNDRFGHDAGDALLREVASRIKRGLRAGDVPARVGGDEFVALLPQVAGIEGAKTVADRVAEFLGERHRIGGTTLYCPASIGILLADNSYKDASAVLRDVDAAMYAAKQAGKSRTSVFKKV